MNCSTSPCFSISTPGPGSPTLADYNLRRPRSSLKYLTPRLWRPTSPQRTIGYAPDQLRSSIAPPAPLGVQLGGAPILDNGRQSVVLRPRL